MKTFRHYLVERSKTDPALNEDWKQWARNAAIGTAIGLGGLGLAGGAYWANKSLEQDQEKSELSAQQAAEKMQPKARVIKAGGKFYYDFDDIENYSKEEQDKSIPMWIKADLKKKYPNAEGQLMVRQQIERGKPSYIAGFAVYHSNGYTLPDGRKMTAGWRHVDPAPEQR